MAAVPSHGAGSLYLQRLRSHGQAVLEQIHSTTNPNSSDVKRLRREVGQPCDFGTSRLEGARRANLRDTAEHCAEAKAHLRPLADVLKLHGVPSDGAVSAEFGEEPSRRKSPTAADMASAPTSSKHLLHYRARMQSLKPSTSRSAFNGKKVLIFPSPQSALKYLSELQFQK
eukprot:TRINITY_DN4992_c0_g2_i3.p1 TRINITY_DN4992_c0_g2~~TRINITY_DN4992_c0_g2_i3.p1  ORF type:complete len:171 (+),score=24.56 TRINITY_DN4992_c0_g2_i3:151-663(+)